MRRIKIDKPDDIGTKVNNEALARSLKIETVTYFVFIVHSVLLALLIFFGERVPLDTHLTGLYYIKHLPELIFSALVLVGVIYYLEEVGAISGYKLEDMPKSECERVLKILDGNPELQFLKERIRNMDRKLVRIEYDFLVNYEHYKSEQARDLACKRLYGVVQS
ncbi:hypothetical protein VCHA53O466_140108 [Vibrio chagasii]|nr:hypothetical protein VCHA53O466_140108 [Vibrio chagasii]